METIKINDMQTKGVVFIVKYSPTETNLAGGEATLNINFNKQEIWYLENEVGIGGTVKVEIVNKEKQEGNPAAGFWVNITKVDMKSGVKGKGEILSPTLEYKDTPKPTNDKMMYSDKDRSITAQCLTKVFCRNMSLITTEPKFVLDAYNYFLGEL